MSEDTQAPSLIKILIVKDGGATKVPKEVPDMAAVAALREQGFEIEVVGGEPTVETVVYADGTEVTGTAPLPEQSPAEQAAGASESPEA